MTDAKNLCIGVGGTVLAFVTPEAAGIAAGLATAAWMLWQLATGIYDRVKGRRVRDRNN